MRRTIIGGGICLLFYLCLSPAQALNNRDNEFGIAIGLNEYQSKDNVLSNIRHRGMLAAIGFSYSRIGDFRLTEIQLNVSINSMTSRYESEKSSFAINPSLNYRQVRRIKDLNENLRLFLGGIGGWNLHNAFYDKWDESHIYWLNSYYIGIDSRLAYRKSEKSNISLDLNFPLIALISRPPKRFLYKELDPTFSWIFSRIHDDMTLTSLHRHFEINMKLEYKYGHAYKFKTGFFWRFSYLRNNISYSKPISILTHTIGIRFLF